MSITLSPAFARSEHVGVVWEHVGSEFDINLAGGRVVALLQGVGLDVLDDEVCGSFPASVVLDAIEGPLSGLARAEVGLVFRLQDLALHCARVGAAVGWA